MRILHISALPVWPLEGKGGMPSLRETLRGHVRGGHEVMLVLPKYNVLGDHAEAISVREDEGYAVHLVPCRWAPALAACRRVARALGGGKELPYPLRWILNVALCALLTVSLTNAAFRLRRRRSEGFDLVYAHNQYAAVAGWVLGHLLGIPNVTRLYGTFLGDLIQRPAVWLRYPVATAGFLIPAALLICANDGTRGDEVARKLGIDPRRFRFWQNGVDLPGEPPHVSREELILRIDDRRLRRDSKWVLSCSRLSYWKRIDRILRAVRYARDRGCDCQFLVAGDGPERARLTQLAGELGVQEDVVWLGAVPHDEIWALMNASDLFVITNDVTNRCNPLYEAICAGLPIASVADPSTADLLHHGVNALLSDKDDERGIGESVLTICSDEAVADRLRAAQRERSQSLWSWHTRMDVEVRELERVVAEARTRRGQAEVRAR